MYDEDNEALAAEYVLGTLSADERERAEGLLLIDPGFEASVRQWERRLGELNVMVEAVEPPADVWSKIKAGAFSSPRLQDVKEEGEARQPAEEEDAIPAVGGEAEGLPKIEETMPHAPGAPHEPELESAETAETAEAFEVAEESPEDAAEPEASEELPTTDEALDVQAEARLAARQSSLFPASEARDSSVSPPTSADRAVIARSRGPTQSIERSADVIYLANRLRNLRRLTVVLGVLVALLAAYVAVWQVAPNLMPPQLRPKGAHLLTRAPTAATSRLAKDRLVAVLQQGPTAPAFLLTLDTRNRTLTLRNVSATAEAGRSYELWLIAGKPAKPLSLGVVGNGQFTQRALPADFDADTWRGASYEVSLEPAGGSPSGMPTGPVLFTGKAVESLPNSPPPPTPKT